MKNLTHLYKVDYCILCGLKGFFGEVSMGRCGESCPCCGYRHFLDWKESEYYKDQMDLNDKYDMRNKFFYCSPCGIIFQLGCLHYSSSPYSPHCGEEDIKNAHFIKKWRYAGNDCVYLGMPHFDNPEEWFNQANLVEVLEMYCPNKNVQCSKSRYVGVCDLV
jgi:hypothetical protein